MSTAMISTEWWLIFITSDAWHTTKGIKKFHFRLGKLQQN